MKRLLVLAAFLPLVACSSSDDDDGGGAGGTGTMSLAVTDAPLTHDMVEEATITIDRITVAPGANATSGFTTLYEGAPITIDLLALRDGVTMDLVDAPVPAGNYRQFRLHVTEARLVLTNGNTYTTEDDTIHLTSQDTSGFKIVVAPPIPVVDQQTTEVLLDVDMTNTFLPIPNADPLDADSFNLLPVVHVSNLGATGGIEGAVMDVGGAIPAEDVTVYVFNPGQTDPANAVTTTATNGAGTFTVLALQPGTYDVMAIRGTDTATVDGVVVTAGTSTTADMTLGTP